MERDLILVLDFGGQYNQLICRRVREAKVYSEMISYRTPLAEIAARRPSGLIFSGGPASVNEPGAPAADPGIYDLGIPVLGICYGMQLMAKQLGGRVDIPEAREYGRTEVDVFSIDGMWGGLQGKQACWMSHGDAVRTPPPGFVTAAASANTPVAAMYDPARRLYAVQFHPEVRHTEHGQEMLERFLRGVCGCGGDWTMDSFISGQLEGIKRRVGGKKVLCALSGGVDSSVAAVLVHKAVGDALTCVYVDHGFMRKDESAQIRKIFTEKFDLNLVFVDAAARFRDRLAGVTEPERKRKIIGEEFIRVFEAEARKLGRIDFLAQGTLYPDVVESGTDTAHTIKSHHNVGGLPADMQFELIEPLRALYKDEAREVGIELGLPEEIIWRQPFPGPGLAVRVIGELTEDKLAKLREADAILREEIRAAALHRDIWQYFAVLPSIRSVGVMGDERTYGYPIILRAVTSEDAMTADWARLPYELLARISNRIVNEVPGVNRVAYDITSKPPGTIEWE